MNPLKRKTRLLALRLTEQEYQRLRAASVMAGCRTLSEFARSGLLPLTSEDPPEAVYKRLLALEDRVNDLHILFHKLAGDADVPTPVR